MNDELSIHLASWFSEHQEVVRQDLATYFDDAHSFTGSWFEPLARLAQPDRFEPGDLVAVTALSVEVPPGAAATILLEQPDRFYGLLERIPAETDLWDADDATVGPGSPADELHQELTSLPGIGWVIAGKLMAAKRPRLIPVYDAVVQTMVAPQDTRFWMALRNQLAVADDRQTIQTVCEGAPEGTSLLRRIDVALWMAGKRQKQDR